MAQLYLAFLLLISGLRVVFAETSLYVPGFDPQPLSADILGVDSKGRTTWAIHKGEPTQSSIEADFVGTATLVLGSDYASLTYVDPGGAFTVGRDCSLASGLAICSASFGTTTEVATETVAPIAVQVATAQSVAITTSQNRASAAASATSANATSTTATPQTTTSYGEALTPCLLGIIISIVMVGVLGFP